MKSVDGPQSTVHRKMQAIQNQVNDPFAVVQSPEPGVTVDCGPWTGFKQNGQ